MSAILLGKSWQFRQFVSLRVYVERGVCRCDKVTNRGHTAGMRVMRTLAMTALVACTVGCDDFVTGYDPTIAMQNGNALAGDTNNSTPPLVLANCSDGSTTQNSHGGVIQCENCALSNDGNALHFHYTSGSYFGVDNSLNRGYCPVDLSGYAVLNFVLSASASARTVRIMLHESIAPQPTCDPNGTTANNAPETVTSWFVTAGTTVQTFSVDLTADTNRNYATYLEMDPQTLNAADDYALNMVTFLP